MNRRPTVGLFISELENAYAHNLYKGVLDAAEQNDVNMIVFPGKSPKSPYQHQYQFNAIYELPTRRSIDALIIASGTMINFIPLEEFEAFYRKYTDVPLVSISIPIVGIPGVLIDNSVGYHMAFDHLIHHHDCKRIAFITGPDNNTEARQRYRVYLDALEKNGIPLDPELVLDGDFTRFSAVRAINDLLVRGTAFDAIAAANDEMALSALKTLKSRGINIPHDAALIGFDNVENARFCSPSLTTVLQPIYEQGRQALSMALNRIGGADVSDIVLDTQLLIRESCGCMSQSVKSINLSRSEVQGKLCDIVKDITDGVFSKIKG
ncbi:MAG: LacI family DNA-binding transcriptional regulator, partial [Chitinivibrionales bacterium]